MQYNKKNAQLFERNPFVLKDEEWKESRSDISPAFTTTKVSWDSIVGTHKLHIQL